MTLRARWVTQGLTALVRGQLSKLHRKILAALITIDVHARDIVEQLAADEVRDQNRCRIQPTDTFHQPMKGVRGFKGRFKLGHLKTIRDWCIEKISR